MKCYRAILPKAMPPVSSFALGCEKPSSPDPSASLGDGQGRGGSSPPLGTPLHEDAKELQGLMNTRHLSRIGKGKAGKNEKMPSGAFSTRID